MFKFRDIGKKKKKNKTNRRLFNNEVKIKSQVKVG